MIRKLILSLFVAWGCMSCHEELPGYISDWSAVQFVFDETSLQPDVFMYSFVGEDESVREDTVWFTVRPQGRLRETSGRIRLEQYTGTYWQYIYDERGIVTDSVEREYARQAEAGVHYVPFDDERVAPLLTLEAGALEARIPVIVLRDESLRDTTYTLFFRIADSEDLQAGDENYCRVQLRVSDCVSEPGRWSKYSFGTYSTVKHEFMIEVTGELWDDDFLASLDRNDRNYYLFILNRALEEENASRVAQGLPTLREDPDDPTSPEISFPAFAMDF